MELHVLKGHPISLVYYLGSVWRCGDFSKVVTCFLFWLLVRTIRELRTVSIHLELDTSPYSTNLRGKRLSFWNTVVPSYGEYGAACSGKTSNFFSLLLGFHLALHWLFESGHLFPILVVGFIWKHPFMTDCNKNHITSVAFYLSSSSLKIN
jgi:hypothetical protein